MRNSAIKFENRKMKNEFSIFNFPIKIDNWKLKIFCHFSIFNFEVKNEMRKKVLFYFNFKLKIECHFRCTDYFPSNLISNSLIRFWILKNKSIMEIQFLKWNLKILFRRWQALFKAEWHMIKLVVCNRAKIQLQEDYPQKVFVSFVNLAIVVETVNYHLNKSEQKFINVFLRYFKPLLLIKISVVKMLLKWANPA